ncbi:MAG: SEC-C metal-binding domain-containing protein [bacterium]
MERRIDDQLAEFAFKFVYPRPRSEAPTARASAPARPAARSAPATDAPSRERGHAAEAGTTPGTPSSRLAEAAGGPVGKVGRNDPCPCGSGKKYKKCCGAG